MTNIFNFIALSLGRLTQFILAFVTIKVMTTLLNPEQVGNYYLMLALISGILFLFINPIGLFINRRINSWERSHLIRQYMFLYLMYLLIVALISSLISIYLINIYFEFKISSLWVGVLISSSVFFNTINTTAIPSLNLLGHPIKYITLIILTVLFSLIFATLFVYNFETSFNYWFSGIVFGQLFVGIIGVIILYANTSGEINFNTKDILTIPKLRNLISFFWPISLSASFAWLHFQSYRFIVDNYLGAYELGIFVAGFGIGLSLIASAELMLTSYLLPKFYRSIEISDDIKKSKAWALYSGTIIPSLLVMGCLITILAPELTKIFLGPEFQSAVNYVIWGVLCEICRVIFGTYSLMAHAKMRTDWVIVPSFIGAIIAISFSIFLINRISIHAVGISMFTAGIISIVSLHIYMSLNIPINLNYRKLLMTLVFAISLYFLDIFIRAYTPLNDIFYEICLVSLYLIIFLISQYFLLYKTIKYYD
jgi:O-antigen/teichoic acid export membrane protein